MKSKKVHDLVCFIDQYYTSFDTHDVNEGFDDLVDFYEAWDLSEDEKKLFKTELLKIAEKNQLREIEWLAGDSYA